MPNSQYHSVSDSLAHPPATPDQEEGGNASEKNTQRNGDDSHGRQRKALTFAVLGVLTLSAGVLVIDATMVSPSSPAAASGGSSSSSSSTDMMAMVNEPRPLSDCKSISIASNYSTSVLSKDWYLVAASDTDEIDMRCDHEKLDYYYDDDEDEYKLEEQDYHYEDGKWKSTTRTYTACSEAGKFETDSGYMYVFHISTYNGHVYMLCYTCGDYFDGVELLYAGYQDVGDDLIDEVNDIIEDTDLSDYTVSATNSTGCSSLTYTW